MRLPPQVHGALVAILVATPLMAQSAAPAVDADPVVLRPGDSMKLTVWRQPELSGEFTIDNDSSLAHPLYHSVKVAGVPFSTVEQRLRTFLEQYDANPQFSFDPMIRVAVGGEVQHPSVYPVRSGATVAQAVALAGGLTQYGRRDRVELRRGGQKVVIDLEHPHVGELSLPVHSGDELIVPRQRSFLKDILVPTFTALGATAAIVNVVLRAQHK
jgi:polysaccharide export outer membrane protein